VSALNFKRGFGLGNGSGRNYRPLMNLEGLGIIIGY